MLQYRLVRLLTAVHGNVFAVGDPFQCIYTWRFASPDNLEKLAVDYGRHAMVTLDQNYRSTSSILAVANAVMAQAKAAFSQRTLWTALTEVGAALPNGSTLAATLLVPRIAVALCHEPLATCVGVVLSHYAHTHPLCRGFAVTLCPKPAVFGTCCFTLHHAPRPDIAPYCFTIPFSCSLVAL